MKTQQSKLGTSSIESCEQPLNLLAARQLFPAHSIHRDNTNFITNNYWSAEPIECQPCPQPLARYLGMRRGRTTIIGYFGWIEKREYFVTLCLCQGFQLMRTRNVHRRDNPKHMCARCTHLEHNEYMKAHPEKFDPAKSRRPKFVLP